MFQDIRFGVRMLARKPGFVTAAVLCLALGIGANVLIFGLVNAMLLRPIAGPSNPEQLVVIIGRNDRNDFALTSYADYQDYQNRSQSLSGLLAYRGTMLNFNSDGFTERIQGLLASNNYFSVLGVQAVAGRTFLAAEDQSSGDSPVAVISHGFWQRRFASDPAVIGKTIILNSHSFTIIGVAQPGFIGTETGEIFDLWVPLSMQAQIMPQIADGLRNRDNRWLLMIGRLKDKSGIRQAQEEMNILSAQLREAYPKEHIGLSGIHLSPHVGIGPVDFPIVSRFLGTVLAIVGLVLLIACANVANLLLVRAAARRKEIAVRLALGATRARIIRQFLTESMLLAIAGAGLGLLIPYFAKDWLLALFPPVTPEALNFTPDIRSVGFTILLSLGTALVFGIVPAIQSSRPDVVPELKEAAMTHGRRQGRLSDLIVIAQIAITVTLLIGAGLLLRTIFRFAVIDPGFATENVLALSLDLKSLGYSEANGQQLYQQLIERTAALPGVEASSLASVMPLGWGSPDQAVFVEGQEPPSPDRPYRADHNVIAPDWFRTMGIPLKSGRDITAQDNTDAPGVVIINETMAQRFWPDQNPIGRHFEIGDKQRRRVEIIGIARNSKHRMLDEEPRPVMYLPLRQQYQPQMILHVRSAVEPLSLVAPIRREVRLLDANLPLFEIKTLAQRLKESIWPARTMSKLVVSFGLIALLLAVIGLYGVLSYTVTQRTREIGIRLVLGAQSADVLKLILRQGMWLAMIGIGVGLMAALALVRVLRGFLSGVSTTDPLTFGGIALLLSCVTLAACWIPARRAAKVDPMRALRHE
jgi:predicted permease